MQAKLLAVIFVLVAFPALAQGNEPARYQLISVSGGFVRLDTVTGVMTFCRDEVDSFRCAPISTDPARAGAQPDAHATPKDGAEREQGKKDDSSAEDFDRALSMMEKAMRSFMAITRENPRECAL